MSHRLVKYLPSLPLFKRAPDDVLEIIAANLQERRLAKDAQRQKRREERNNPPQ